VFIFYYVLMPRRVNAYANAHAMPMPDANANVNVMSTYPIYQSAKPIGQPASQTNTATKHPNQPTFNTCHTNDD